MAMKLRPSHPVGQALGPLAEQVHAVPAQGVAVPDIRITGVTLRGQDAEAGDLFAALPGSSSHGGRYVDEAVRRGAVAVLTDAAGLEHWGHAPASGRYPHPLAGDGPDSPVPVLIHPDPRSVLGELAATVYGHPSEALRVIGVTGTSGKTTTTYLMEAGLRAADRVAGLIGTVGIRIDGRDVPSALTTPEAPELQALLAVMVERGVDTVVMEVSSHALTLGRVDGVNFAVGGFTNLSRDHLDFHPSMQDYFEAKARLFDPQSPTHAAISVVCIDDDAGRAMAARAYAPGVGQRDRARRRLAGRGRSHGRAGCPGIPGRRPGRRPPRAADRAARPLQRRELPSGGGVAGRGRGIARAGRAGSAHRGRPGPAGVDRPGAGLPGAGRLRP